MDLIPEIAPRDEAAAHEARAELDRKTKPLGSLGDVEELVVRIAAIRGTADLEPLDATIVVVAADHGYATEGVSAYPAEVTQQMLANFAAGGAAINILAARAGARLIVVDAGVSGSFHHPNVRSMRLGEGTANAANGPAMTLDQAEGGIATGIELAAEVVAAGAGIVVLGEMGIGNTTAASALTAALLPADAALVCGRGTGIDDNQLACKVEVVRRALATNRGSVDEPIAALAALGGFELAILAGVALGAAAGSAVVLLDGFVSTAAALVAARLEPSIAGRMVASHLSPEPGHGLLLADLGLKPLLELGLRLGEGSGAALALPILNAALALMAEMATFEQAGVSTR